MFALTEINTSNRFCDGSSKSSKCVQYDGPQGVTCFHVVRFLLKNPIFTARDVFLSSSFVTEGKSKRTAYSYPLQKN